MEKPSLTAIIIDDSAINVGSPLPLDANAPAAGPETASILAMAVTSSLNSTMQVFDRPISYWWSFTGATRIEVYGAALEDTGMGAATATYNLDGNATTRAVPLSINNIANFPFFVSSTLDPSRQYNLSVDVDAQPASPYVLDYIILYKDLESTTTIAQALESSSATSTPQVPTSQSSVPALEATIRPYALPVIGVLAGLCGILLVAWGLALSRVRSTRGWRGVLSSSRYSGSSVKLLPMVSSPLTRRVSDPEQQFSQYRKKSLLLLAAEPARPLSPLETAPAQSTSAARNARAFRPLPTRGPGLLPPSHFPNYHSVRPTGTYYRSPRAPNPFGYSPLPRADAGATDPAPSPTSTASTSVRSLAFGAPPVAPRTPGIIVASQARAYHKAAAAAAAGRRSADRKGQVRRQGGSARAPPTLTTIVQDAAGEEGYAAVRKEKLKEEVRLEPPYMGSLEDLLRASFSEGGGDGAEGGTGGTRRHISARDTWDGESPPAYSKL
ncbi:uncharacterized protein BXZ73DRAFT_74478 [Epithele typhae]|uniref:uncharacterized protein n=1 Tax=Epithele typhae TaxID=378194 RepID=UPI002007CEEF|nr:uncharacterized protein BXZ73DRAFT_74478 [Epithele typhae]KAH9942170.1 hypothetical protein BXZ73DRAFT_74478 [Epithele typhae]